MRRQDTQGRLIHLQLVSFLCLFGKGTKISKYLIEHDKIYEATVKLGIATDTGDIELKIIQKKVVDL